MVAELIEVQDGRAVVNLHDGQMRVLESTARIILVLAGTQSGKTVTGPWWLLNEIRDRGPGDYMVVTPTFPLLELKALPEFKSVFMTRLQLGDYLQSPVRKFTLSEAGAARLFGHNEDYLTQSREVPTQVFFGHASEPDSLESATGKGFWLDEAGQKSFKLASWQALQRRGAIHQARYLITTTPYDLGWLKQRLYDKAKAGDRTIEVINFRSIDNPAFPLAEYERARDSLPAWQFNMFYRGLFERPAGLIYDSFDEQQHKVPRFALPPHWRRHLGLDFGGVNTVALFYAAEQDGQGRETDRLFLYREYKAGGRTAQAHAEAILKAEPMVPNCVGGSKSEGQWRQEFRAGGLPVQPPDITDVEVGITRVYGAHTRGEILVFDDLAGYLEQKQTYSRELDANGEPTEKIEDKETYHFLDAERYIIGKLKRVNAPTLVRMGGIR